MRLRICICLFITLSMITAVSVFGYLTLRSDYADLRGRYEEAMEQAVSETQKQKDTDVSLETEEEKEQDQAASDAFYYVTLNNNEIIAYTGDHREICMRTRIDEEELAAALIQELKQGMYLENLPALYEYLENCSS